MFAGEAQNIPNRIKIEKKSEFFEKSRQSGIFLHAFDSLKGSSQSYLVWMVTNYVFMF